MKHASDRGLEDLREMEREAQDREERQAAHIAELEADVARLRDALAPRGTSLDDHPADRLIADLCDRGGLKSVWSELDAAVREEIRARWAAIIDVDGLRAELAVEKSLRKKAENDAAYQDVLRQEAERDAKIAITELAFAETAVGLVSEDVALILDGLIRGIEEECARRTDAAAKLAVVGCGGQETAVGLGERLVRSAARQNAHAIAVLSGIHLASTALLNPVKHHGIVQGRACRDRGDGRCAVCEQDMSVVEDRNNTG